MTLTTEEPLIEASALAGFPGAPFSAAQVRSAADSLRTQAGWHIAPTIEQTVEVYTGRGRIALLPSLHVVDVLRVEDASNGREVTGWRVRRQAGLLVSDSPFPEDIDVTLLHGFEKCPEDLKPLVAERARRIAAGEVRQESLGSRSVTLAAEFGPISTSVLERYMLFGET